ncbi:MAG: PHP domain-containing protein, partial [Candidatus Roizmanbacteria bacterium]
MIKIDLHTHSILSHDGGISQEEYEKVLSQRILDNIAITDHNEIDFALKLQQKLGGRIIVGEEIMTQSGEVIGLYLSEYIKPYLTLEETVHEIKNQGGLVYVPHPFDIRRHAIGNKNCIGILSDIDIIETFNARNITFFNNKKAELFAQKNSITPGLGSDSHSFSELGRSYCSLENSPDKTTLKELLKRGT